MSGVSYASGRGMWNHIIAFGFANVFSALGSLDGDRRHICPRSVAPSGWNGRSIGEIDAEVSRNQSIWDLNISEARIGDVLFNIIVIGVHPWQSLLLV